jgi:hypothetical protein
MLAPSSKVRYEEAKGCFFSSSSSLTELHIRQPRLNPHISVATSSSVKAGTQRSVPHLYRIAPPAHYITTHPTPIFTRSTCSPSLDMYASLARESAKPNSSRPDIRVISAVETGFLLALRAAISRAHLVRREGGGGGVIRRGEYGGGGSSCGCVGGGVVDIAVIV